MENTSGGRQDHMKRRAIRLLLAVAALGLSSIIGAGALINRAAQGRTYSDVRSIPRRRVGLLLGCAMTLPGGWLNPFFSTRVEAAAELYHAGKVNYLLVI